MKLFQNYHLYREIAFLNLGTNEVRVNFMFLEFLSLKNIMRDINCGLFLYSLMEDACMHVFINYLEYANMLLF